MADAKPGQDSTLGARLSAALSRVVQLVRSKVKVETHVRVGGLETREERRERERNTPPLDFGT